MLDSMLQFIFLVTYEYLELMLVLLILENVCGASFEISKNDVLFLFLTNTVLFGLSAIFFDEDQAAKAFWFQPLLGQTVIYILIKGKRILSDLILIIEALCIYVAVTIMPGFFIASFLGEKKHGYNIQGMDFNYSDMTLMIISFLVLFYVRDLLKKHPVAKRPNWLEFVLAILLLVGEIVLTSCVMFTVDLNSPSGILWGCVVIASFLAFLILFVYRVTKNKLNIYRRNEELIQKQYDAFRLESLMGYKDREEAIRKMRHDFLNHIAIIDGLCETEDVQGIRDYVSSLSATYITPKKFSTGNDITDVVINKLGQKAEEKNIQFIFSGSFAGWEFMSGPDLSGILINAINNAIEACEGKENQYIEVSVNETDFFRTLAIKNPIDKKRIIFSNSLKTTKEDKENHGYGLAIIEQIANRYHATFKIASTESEFILTISLSKKKVDKLA